MIPCIETCKTALHPESPQLQNWLSMFLTHIHTRLQTQTMERLKDLLANTNRSQFHW